MNHPTSIEVIVGLLSVLIFLYRIIYVMIPMYIEGYNKNNYSTIMKSLTLLV